MTSLLQHRFETFDFNKAVELYLRCNMMERGIHLTDNEYRTLIYFYNKGAVITKDDIKKVVDLNYFKSAQTVENAKSKFRKLNIVTKDNMFNYKIVPKVTTDELILDIKWKASKFPEETITKVSADVTA